MHLPSPVTTIGFTSSSAHVFGDESRVELFRAAPHCLARSPVRPSFARGGASWSGMRPAAGSMCQLDLSPACFARPPRCPCRLRSKHKGDAALGAVDQRGEIKSVAIFEPRRCRAVRTCRACLGPVCFVTSVMPSIAAAPASRRRASLHPLTPPALPRPPAWICAFTTRYGDRRVSPRRRPPRRRVNAGCPRGTATPDAQHLFGLIFVDIHTTHAPPASFRDGPKDRARNP